MKKTIRQEAQHTRRADSRPTFLPRGRAELKSGVTGESYFRILVRPREEFMTFRYHDIGEKGHIQRLAGRRRSGSWGTQAWLISKSDAHLENGKLVADSEVAEKILQSLGPQLQKIKADVFKAEEKIRGPKKKEATEAQVRSRLENIRRAQAARWIKDSHVIPTVN